MPIFQAYQQTLALQKELKYHHQIPSQLMAYISLISSYLYYGPSSSLALYAYKDLNRSLSLWDRQFPKSQRHGAPQRRLLTNNSNNQSFSNFIPTNNILIIITTLIHKRLVLGINWTGSLLNPIHNKLHKNLN